MTKESTTGDLKAQMMERHVLLYWNHLILLILVSNHNAFQLKHKINLIFFDYFV